MESWYSGVSRAASNCSAFRQPSPRLRNRRGFSRSRKSMNLTLGYSRASRSTLSCQRRANSSSRPSSTVHTPDVYTGHLLVVVRSLTTPWASGLPVEERRLGPVVGLGTYRTFEGDVARARAVVDAAFTSGSTVYDSSPMYGDAQSSLGVALSDGRRDETTIATKIWTSSVADGRWQYEEQRGFFGRIEIQQVHNLVAWQEQLPWLEEEKAAGSIDRIGGTHWSSGSFSELERALRTGRFDVVQMPLDVLGRECEERLLPLASELGSRSS